MSHITAGQVRESSQSYEACAQTPEAWAFPLPAFDAPVSDHAAAATTMPPSLTQVLEALPAGVVVLDGQGRVLQCNGTALDYLGSPLLGELWREVIVRAFRSFGDGDAVPLHDGRLLNVATNPLGEGPGQVLLLRDVTESCAIQEMFNRHQRLASMGEMAASLAHQIRTPLASCLLYLSHLGRAEVATEERRRCVAKMRSCLDHLERMVSDMLVFAKGEQLGEEEFPLAGLLQDAQRMTAPLLEAGSCELVIRDESAGRHVRGNRDALLGALQNVITNAIHACCGCTEEKRRAAQDDSSGRSYYGRLELEAQAIGVKGGSDALQIILRDNGPGMSAEVQTRVFEPFYTTKAEGTGLGLAVVEAVIRAHHGVVWLDSHAGEGTTVGIELPVFPSAE
ncbi:MAG: PAS domain-containing sensor histidine kinase [Gammaproteobacteria bacterium]